MEVTLKITARKQGLISLIQLLSPGVEGDLDKMSTDELYDLYLKLRA
jgi:hypothetical protein